MRAVNNLSMVHWLINQVIVDLYQYMLNLKKNGKNFKFILFYCYT